MTTTTSNPVPPFRAVQETGGAWPDRYTWWTVVDAAGNEPYGEEWCRRVADALNVGETNARQRHAMDYRIRRLEAALRVARGYVRADPSEQARRDLRTIDEALARTDYPAEVEAVRGELDGG